MAGTESVVVKNGVRLLALKGQVEGLTQTRYYYSGPAYIRNYEPSEYIIRLCRDNGRSMKPGC